jgi:hypothetical protein
MEDSFFLVRPLDNVTCPYCGTALTSKTRTKEHVIGRRFVPVGSLDREWNLILQACGPCNRHKADLEDDISVGAEAILTHPADPILTRGWKPTA